MRFYDVDEGAVLYDGRDVREVTVESLRRQLGVVFQDTFLFDTTIRENIAMGRPDASDVDIERASRAAELHEFVETLPRGYNTLVGERGGRLSGGQRQRLAIARALLRDPTVLLLDEATSALDPRTERMISDTLLRVGRGRTTVAVTHRLTSISGYDRIFVMSGGRLAEQGTHDELLALGGTYAELWAEQTAGVTPVEARFDAAAALGAVSIFFGLPREGLLTAADRLKAFDLQAGARVPEGGGGLMLVRRGRPRVLSPGLDGELVTSAELQPGDSFGLSALLGEERGAVLAAEEPVGMLALDAGALQELADLYPSVADMLAGSHSRVAAPSGGARLSRASLVVRERPRPPVRSEAVDAPTGEDIRRMSGAFRAVEQ
jgi:ABC-type polar amino acid transport system ATPase subunit